MLCRWLNSKFNKIQSAAGEWKSKTFQVMENRMKIWQALGRETCTPISGIILLRRMLISKKRERFLRTKWDESRRIVDLVSTLYAAASTNGDKKIRRTCPVLPISELVAFLRFQFQTFGQTYEVERLSLDHRKLSRFSWHSITIGQRYCHNAPNEPPHRSLTICSR